MPHHVALSVAEIERFVVDGCVRLDNAFSGDLADSCRRILWLATGCREDEPSPKLARTMRRPAFASALISTSLEHSHPTAKRG